MTRRRLSFVIGWLITFVLITLSKSNRKIAFRRNGLKCLKIFSFFGIGAQTSLCKFYRHLTYDGPCTYKYIHACVQLLLRSIDITVPSVHVAWLGRQLQQLLDRKSLANIVRASAVRQLYFDSQSCD